MKILLIQVANSSFSPQRNKFVRAISMLWPPSTIEYIATLTPPRHSVTLINDYYDYIPIDEKFDLVGISYFTATATKAYQIADSFRENNIPVVLGGYHATALPKEAKQHADSVLIGEAERIWPIIVRDYESGKPKPFYKQLKPVDISKYSKPKKYNPVSPLHIGGIEATRGCPFKCEFCAISNSPIGNLYRKKDIEKVIEEIEALSYKTFVFYDSSLTVDMKYTKELFRRMKSLNKRFVCFGNTNIIKDEELLSLAGEAGCIAWAIGFETISEKMVNEIKSKFKKPSSYKEIVEKIHQYGMAVVGSFVFGFDTDTPDVFDNTIQAINEYKIDSMAVSILTPFPGTPLYKRLKRENRIITKDWSKYDMNHVVFKPKNMSPEELYEGTKRIALKYHSLPSILKRSIRSLKLGLYQVACVFTHSLSSNILYKSAYK